MRLLLDTHILLWALARTALLQRDARELLQDEKNAVFFSAASVWEVAIKSALRRPDFDVDPTRLFALAIEAGFRELAVTSRAAGLVAHLPLHHRDPFDRLLVAQAIDEEANLLTADAVLAAYGPQVMTLAPATHRNPST